MKQIPFRVEEQLHALDELAKQEVAAIAMTPYNDERIRRYIDALYEQGIPVVTFNSDIEFSRRIAYVGSNYTQSGATAAGLIRLLTHGETHVGIVTGSHQLLCHSQRIAGFTEALKPYQHRIHLTATVENHDDEIESYEQTLHLLQEHPEINALFFAAGGVYGGCRAVSALGLEGHLTILSYDMVPTTRALLEQGIISATICQQPALQGSRPLSILFDYLTNGKLPSAERYYTAADIRIRENL